MCRWSALAQRPFAGSRAEHTIPNANAPIGLVVFNTNIQPSQIPFQQTEGFFNLLVTEIVRFACPWREPQGIRPQ
jgi:hypothetical protein